MTAGDAQSARVLLLDARANGSALLFEEPEDHITCHSLAEVRDTLSRLDAASASGAHLAGFATYEAGYAFEEKLKALAPAVSDLPLIWFGLFKAPRVLTSVEALDWLDSATADRPRARISDLTFDMDRESYDEAFAAVQDHLARGDIYQANLTMRARFRLDGDPLRLFSDLIRRQPVGHAAYLELGATRILSLSPELFLEREAELLRTRPMKGTAKRGRTMREDRRIARELAADPKAMAENVMIVDLMRNDMSRVAKTGSVKVPLLFSVETYRTLFQMTSTVEGRLPEDMSLTQIFENLFPCGSITGAPKLSAMQILHALETSPRGVYTGSIGHVTPRGDFRFNVAIRTLVIGEDGTGEVGTGSGVVFDSQASPEYDECLLKLRFMSEHDAPFGLIETMRWTPQDGYFLLSRHLDRLAESAAYFDFAIDLQEVEQALANRAATFSGDTRVRLEVSSAGAFSLIDEPLTAPAGGKWTAALCAEPTDAADPFLFHKTTRREFYDATRKRIAAETGCDEVLFANREGFLTEGSFTTLFIERNGRLLTPALRHGLLPGTLRAALLETGRAVEADLRIEDLQEATLYLGNSVRGLIRTEILSFERQIAAE